MKTFFFFLLLNTVLLATPLHQAVEDINEKKVMALVNEGADVNALDKYGRTPLHLAMGVGRYSLVKFLIEHGADIHIKDSAHKTPLVYAIEKNRMKVIIYVSTLVNKERPSKTHPLFSAIREGDTEAFSREFNAADINVTDADGKTLLHLACEYRREDIVEALLKLGIDKEARDHDGRDALNYAKLSGNKKIIELLQENNATK